MLKAQVLRRHFSLFNRVPYGRIARSAARDGHESVTIHRVRIGRPVFSRSRIFGTFVIATSFWALSRYLNVEVKEVKADEATPAAGQPSEGGGEEEDEEDYDDALLFFPTGFSRPRPKTFYKGSDPEWHEFMKVAKDPPRIIRIRKELASFLRNMAKTAPGWTNAIGAVDETKGNVWFEFKFPEGPPTEWERPGYELTEDLGWRKATRPVADVHHQRLKKIMYPTTVATSLYQDTIRKTELSWKVFRSQLGWGEQPTPETVKSVLQSGLANPSLPPSTGVLGTPTAPSTPASVASDSKQSTEASSSLSSQKSKLGPALPDSKKLLLDLTNFRQDIQKKLRRPDQRPHLQPPRGTFTVLGLVEIHGARAKVTLNVNAAYDPKLNRFVTMKIEVWNITSKKQAPKGGP